VKNRPYRGVFVGEFEFEAKNELRAQMVAKSVMQAITELLDMYEHDLVKLDCDIDALYCGGLDDEEIGEEDA